MTSPSIAKQERQHLKPQKKVLEQSLPFWHDLTEAQRSMLLDHFQILSDKKGRIFYDIGYQLRGPKILTGGIARLFITADEGREITLFHIVDSQLCLISAICSIQKLPYTFNLEFLSDSLTYYLPAEYYQQLSQENLAVAKMKPADSGKASSGNDYLFKPDCLYAPSQTFGLQTFHVSGASP